MSEKVYEYELVDNTKNDEVIAKIWWTGRTIESDSSKLLKTLKSIRIGEYTFADGLDFYQRLPRHFRAGYTHLRTVK